MPKSTADEIKFVDFCNFLEDLRACSKKHEKIRKLEEFYDHYRRIGEILQRNDASADTSFYPILRLLLPQSERERPAYGLSRYSLRRILSKILTLPKGSSNFRKLGSDVYDFADTAYNLLSKQFSRTRNLTLAQLNKRLDLIAAKQRHIEVCSNIQVAMSNQPSSSSSSAPLQNDLLETLRKQEQDVEMMPPPATNIVPSSQRPSSTKVVVNPTPPAPVVNVSPPRPPKQQIICSIPTSIAFYAQKDKLFLKLFQHTSPIEQKWILRIVLKNLALGISENKILNTFHPNALMHLNATNSLPVVCEALNDPNIRISDTEITLFTPVRPMLSKRCDAKELFKSISDNKVVIVEMKFDGERFQLHMKDHSFKYFSRRGYDFTKKFGDSYTSGIYTPLLEGAFNKNVKSIILDGEMMGWNRHTKEFGSKGMNFDVKNLSKTSVHQPCFCVFDILLYNDEVLADQPLDDRLKILKSVFTGRQGVIVHSIKTEVFTKQDIVSALNESMDNKEEGIVYKDPFSLYVPNDRNSGWWKMKLEYFSGVMTDLDLLVMGGFYGKGHKIDSFIVGVSTSEPHTQKSYLALAKITAGLSSEEWSRIRRFLEPNWVKTLGENYENYRLGFGKAKPDVWIPPKKSCIVLVRATELVQVSRMNSEFKTPYTLRFPRIEKIRFDKPSEDCLTLTELEELTQSPTTIHKLYNKHLRLDDVEYETRITKKFKSKFIDTNVQVEEKVSDILKDHEFHVLSGTEEWRIDDVERTIKANGGAIVKAEGDNTYCILAGDRHIRLDYYKGPVDIVKLAWLWKVLEQGKICPHSPAETIYACEKTKNRFDQTYDKYGDSYTEKATDSSLEFAINNMQEKEDYVSPLPMEVDDLHAEMNFDGRLNIFDGYTVYFDKYKIINDSSSDVIYDSTLDEATVEFWGGKCTTALTPDVNLIVTKPDEEARKNEIEAHEAYVSPVAIVDMSFLNDRIQDYESNDYE